MDPRLVAIAGVSRGREFPLAGDEVSIGRDATNQVCISDPSLSRRHTLIKREGDRFVIIDQESRNGTFVNGVPINERVLEHGDRIQIGDSLLLFLSDEDGISPLAESIELDDRSGINRSTVRLRMKDALYLHPERLPTTPLPMARMARDLSTLVKISTSISSKRDLTTLQQQLLDLILEAVPAEQGAILLVDSDMEEFESTVVRQRRPDSNRPAPISRTITQQVLQEGIAILNEDVLDEEPSNLAQSLLTRQVRSLLCVPLVSFERVVGVFYLETNDPKDRFDENDLQLVTAIAGIAAIALENVRHIERLESENERLREDIDLEHDMVGESSRMKEVLRFISKVAPTDSTVLICGESGTGKELVARAIYRNSPRSDEPFVAINCAALTETLLESDLFGHEKGAFTGATAQKKGKLEVADGGTVFLDEVGEMSPALQVKLLRVLQEREFERVGGTRPIKIDIRLIAATNKNLEEAVKDGSFREDLYYRLNVVSLTMPPLRERREDIPLLASYFVANYSRKLKRRIAGLSPEARACLMNYDWPGNVRELENAIERAVVLGSTDVIQPDDLPETVLETASTAELSGLKYHERINELKRRYILEALEQTGGNYAEAAKLLGMHPNNLHRLARNLGLKDLKEE